MIVKSDDGDAEEDLIKDDDDVLLLLLLLLLMIALNARSIALFLLAINSVFGIYVTRQLLCVERGFPLL